MNYTQKLRFLKFIVIVGLFIFSQATTVWAQCGFTPTAQSNCSDCTQNIAPNTMNLNLGASTIACFTGNGAITNLGLNGGTLRVCGNLTINGSVNYNSGFIVIESGASLTINPSNGEIFLGGNSEISNYGIFTISNNIELRNGTGNIFNASTGTIDFSSVRLRLNHANSLVVNEGQITVNNLDISKNGATVCQKNGASLDANNITNNSLNSFQSTGPSCLHFSGNANLQQNLTNSSDLIVCQGSGATTSGSANYGAATVEVNCNGCTASSLPVSFLSFSVFEKDNHIKVNWQTATERNSDYFLVERSADGLNFEAISEHIRAAGESIRILEYSWTDTDPLPGTNYYRIKQVDLDQTFTYSILDFVNIAGQKIWEIYPNPVASHLQIKGYSIHELSIYDLQGMRWKRWKNPNQGQFHRLDLSSLPKGIYFLTIQSLQGIHREKIVKN